MQENNDIETTLSLFQYATNVHKIKAQLEGARESAYLCQVKRCKHKKRGSRRKSRFATGEGG